MSRIITPVQEMKHTRRVNLQKLPD